MYEEEITTLETEIEKFSIAEKFEEFINKKFRVNEQIIKISKREKEIIEFLHLNIHPSQLRQFKSNYALKGLVLPFFSFLIGLALSSNFIQIFLTTLAGVIAYVIYLYYITNILTIIFELEKLYSYREAINFIQYLVMQLRLNPNLEKAVEFSSKYIRGCFGRDIRIKLKEVMLNPLLTAEDVLDHITSKWGDIIPGLKSSINLIKASIIEKDKARRQELLDGAISEISDAIYLDISKRIKSLKQPSMALFYMGVLLPVLLSILYPILVFTPAAILASKPIAISLFWFVLPSLLILFMTFLILQRPIIYFVKCRMKVNISVLEIIFYFIFTVFSLFLLFYFFKNTLLTIIPLLFFGILVSSSLAKKVKKAYLEIIKIKEIEKEFPDTLYLMATKLNQGRPIEEAVEYVIQMLPKYHITQTLYKQIYELFTKTGATLEQILFSPEFNVAEMIGSDIIYNSLKTVIDATKLGPRTSASIISSIISQLSKLRKTNELINDMFSEIASAMKFLSVFVAPFTLGIVSGLYNVSLSVVSSISKSFLSSGLGFGAIGAMLGVNVTNLNLMNIPSPEFMALVLGIYTLIIAILLTIYSEYIKEGPIFPEILYILSKNLIIAVIFYSIGLAIGTLCLGKL